MAVLFPSAAQCRGVNPFYPIHRAVEMIQSNRYIESPDDVYIATNTLPYLIFAVYIYIRVLVQEALYIFLIDTACFYGCYKFFFL